ncbi:MAG TPA: metal-binding protein [Lachnospiraceae bacterium]|nr:metal-binding protein [Lachnospiraceae bacterium]
MAEENLNEVKKKRGPGRPRKVKVVIEEPSNNAANETKKSFTQPLTCADCKVKACFNNEVGKYPSFCLTTDVDKDLLKHAKDIYLNDEIDKRLALTAAYVEGNFYGKYTRVQETIEFIKKFGAKKVGIATCVGLLNETSIFAKLLKQHGIEYYAVGCKIGAIEKSEIGIPPQDTLTKGEKYESMCNPIMQAKVLNAQKTDLNVLVGLCVGHDALFMRYVEAPTTVLIVKDRVTGHNPAVPLYTINSIYNKI